MISCALGEGTTQNVWAVAPHIGGYPLNLRAGRSQKWINKQKCSGWNLYSGKALLGSVVVFLDDLEGPNSTLVKNKLICLILLHFTIFLSFPKELACGGSGGEVKICSKVSQGRPSRSPANFCSQARSTVTPMLVWSTRNARSRHFDL